MDKHPLVKAWGIGLALVVMTLSSAFEAAINAGAVPQQQQEARLMLDTEQRTRMNIAAANVEESKRMLQDLHAGIAPRDHNMTPQWTAMRAALDATTNEMRELRRALDRNARQAERLGFELEDSRHLAPANRAPLLGAKAPPSLIQRVIAWFN